MPEENTTEKITTFSVSFTDKVVQEVCTTILLVAVIIGLVALFS